MEITSAEKKKYALIKKIDFAILKRIKRLESKKLNKEDNRILIFIKTQMEHDWRKPLIKELNKIERRY
jgi:hypothetical protein